MDSAAWTLKGTRSGAEADQPSRFCGTTTSLTCFTLLVEAVGTRQRRFSTPPLLPDCEIMLRRLSQAVYTMPIGLPAAFLGVYYIGIVGVIMFSASCIRLASGESGRIGPSRSVTAFSRSSMRVSALWDRYRFRAAFPLDAASLEVGGSSISLTALFGSVLARVEVRLDFCKVCESRSPLAAEIWRCLHCLRWRAWMLACGVV